MFTKWFFAVSENFTGIWVCDLLIVSIGIAVNVSHFIDELLACHTPLASRLQMSPDFSFARYVDVSGLKIQKIRHGQTDFIRKCQMNGLGRTTASATGNRRLALSHRRAGFTAVGACPYFVIVHVFPFEQPRFRLPAFSSGEANGNFHHSFGSHHSVDSAF